MKDFDFISHNSWKAKIFISCFPGLNEQKIFDSELMDQTLESIAKLGCTNIISLVESHEIEDICGLDFFSDQFKKHDFTWHHLPIVDYEIPDKAFMENWGNTYPGLLNELKNGNNIFIHCKGGIGRSGTVAAMFLIESGTENSHSILAVRSKRQGAIENEKQEDFVRSFEPRRIS